MLSFLRADIRTGAAFAFDGVATGVRWFRSKAQGGRPAKGKAKPNRPSRHEKVQRQHKPPQRTPKLARKEFGSRSDSFRSLSYGRRRDVSEDRPVRPFASIDIQKPKAPPKKAAQVVPSPAKSTQAAQPNHQPQKAQSTSKIKPKTESKDSQKLLMLFGRKTVLDALQDPTIEFHSIHMLDKLRDADQAVSALSSDVETSPISVLFAAAQKFHKDLEIQFVSRKELAQISKHQQQDQGVVAQIVAPKDRSVSVASFLKAKPQQYAIVALEGIASETNMGTIVRTTTASPSIDAMLLLEGCCSVQNPIVQFASCGVALKAKFIQSYSSVSAQKKATAEEGPGAISVQALEKFKSDGAAICVLAPAAEESLFDFKPPEKVIYILGAESTGVSEKIKSIATHKLRIPLARSVESLSVASTAAIIAFFQKK